MVVHHIKINHVISAQGEYYYHTLDSVFSLNIMVYNRFYPNRQLLLCRVTLGKSFLQFSAMKMAHSPPGMHFCQRLVHIKRDFRSQSECLLKYFFKRRSSQCDWSPIGWWSSFSRIRCLSR